MPQGRPPGKGGTRWQAAIAARRLRLCATHDRLAHMSAEPNAEPAGYLYDIPRSTVALAGGMVGLMDLFASRLNGYFRHDDCVTVHLHGSQIHLECDAALSWLREQDATASGDAVQLRLDMADTANEGFGTAHRAFADLVAVWPEVSAWRAIPAAAPSDLTLIAQARAIVIADQKCSTSYLQRKLQIGYNRAASLVEQLERDGVVSAADFTGKRQILLDA